MGRLITCLVVLICVLVVVKCTWVKEMENPELWQGDIILDPDEDERRKEGTATFASLKGGRWPGGKIPYVITGSIGSKGVQVINEAIANYHKYTCIRFHRKTSKDKSYISFFRGQGCYSPVGYRRDRVNHISLATGCWYTGIVMHEIGHSLGFLHEQSRPDRDKYVRIIFSNIKKDFRSNFEKKSTTLINSLGTPYDYNSMMHYGPKAFGDGKVTIETVDRSKQNVIGQRKGFSKIDIQQLGLMYNRICKGSGGGTGGGGGGGGTGGSCYDKKSNCDGWAMIGYCTNPKWRDFMRKECCKSCNRGGGGTGGGCYDKKPSCGDWAKADYCTSSQWKDFMRKECCKSCDNVACVDKKDYCSGWTREGHCTNSQWREFMTKECCRSCRG